MLCDYLLKFKIATFSLRISKYSSSNRFIIQFGLTFICYNFSTYGEPLHARLPCSDKPQNEIFQFTSQPDQIIRYK